MRTIRDVPLSTRDRDAVEEAARLLRSGFPVEGIILFGSKARGEDDEESDIDLLVLTTRPLDWAEQQAMTAALLPLQLARDVVISTIVVPAEEWEEGVYQALPLRDEVERDGVAA